MEFFMNELPKIDFPIHNINVPSLKTNFRFRPFLVKEEKLLLMAKESDNPTDILSSIKQVINNCSVDKKFDVNKLTIFDLEYVFLKLRAVSVDNIVKVAYKDNEDDQIYDFEVDLNTVEVKFPKKMENVVKINKTTGLIMKYPSASLYDDEEFLNLEKDHFFQLIIRCLDKVYQNEEVYEAKDYTIAQLEEFLENLDIKVFEKVQEFLMNVPKLDYRINYKNSLGNDREIVLSSLNDFFIWR
jgi:hypothetical protein